MNTKRSSKARGYRSFRQARGPPCLRRREQASRAKRRQGCRRRGRKCRRNLTRVPNCHQEARRARSPRRDRRTPRFLCDRVRWIENWLRTRGLSIWMRTRCRHHEESPRMLVGWSTTSVLPRPSDHRTTRRSKSNLAMTMLRERNRGRCRARPQGSNRYRARRPSTSKSSLHSTSNPEKHLSEATRWRFRSKFRAGSNRIRSWEPRLT